MIKASDLLIKFFDGQENKTNLCKRLDISMPTLYRIMRQESNVDEKTIAAVLNVTGFDFEKAFEVGE